MAPRSLRGDSRSQPEDGLAGLKLDAAVGRRVRLRRTLLGISQTELAEQISLSQQQMALVERGEGRLFASHLYLLSRVLDVSVDFFFGQMDRKTGSSRIPSTRSTEKTSLNDGDICLNADGRSDREVRDLIKAFLRIPHSVSRSRLLSMIKRLADEPDEGAVSSVFKNSDD